MVKTVLVMNIMLMIFGNENLQPMRVAYQGVYRTNLETFEAGALTRITRRAIQRRDPCRRMNHVRARYFKYACIKNWAYAHGYLEKRRIFAALIQGATDEQHNVWSYGFASGICDRTYPFMLTTFAKVNGDGEDRTEHDIIAIMHELGHIRGAKHDASDPNIMHPDALRYVDPTLVLHYNDLALGQINRCSAR